MATSAIRRTPMPARISRGLSRNGRRPLGAPEGPLDRLGVMVVAVAAMRSYEPSLRSRTDNEHEGHEVSSLRVHRGFANEGLLDPYSFTFKRLFSSLMNS